MRSSIIITLSFHFILCQRVSSSRYSIIENQMANAYNVLEMFFEDFNKAYLVKNEPLQVVIVGASTDEFQQAMRPLFDSYPFMICTDLELCQYPEFFCGRSFFVIFLNDLIDKTFANNAKILARCNGQCTLLFVIKGAVAKTDDILTFLTTDHQIHGSEYELVHFDKDVVKHYGIVYKEDCSIGIESQFAWKLGTEFSLTNIILFDRLSDLNGCPVPVGTFPYSPQMIIDKKKDGSSMIVGGQDGSLALMIAEKLNFTIALKYPSETGASNDSRKLAILRDIDKGIIEFAVGRFRPMSAFTFSKTFDNECITFAVPKKITNFTDNILWTEFPWKVWIIIGLIFITGCLLKYTLQTMILLTNVNRQDSGFVSTVLDVVSIHLGLPVLQVPVSASSRLTFATYLCYGIVITTAYKTSLSSILTTVPNLSSIENIQGIIDANLRVGGSFYHRNILADQADEVGLASELLKRYDIYDNHSNAMHRLEADQNFAYLARRSTLLYERFMIAKAHEYINFDILNECVLTYPTVVAFRNGSHLLEPVNELILRLKESDILEYWNDNYYWDVKTLERENDELIIAQYTKQKFYHIFVFYCCCLAVSTLVFFIELRIARVKPIPKQQINRRDILL